jgi:hypothetical protein
VRAATLRHVHPRTLKRLAFSLAILAAWALLLAAEGGFGLALAPAFALALLLVHERYVGVELIVRLRERRAHRAAPLRPARRLRLPATPVSPLQGIARCFALASRPPPPAGLAQH